VHVAVGRTSAKCHEPTRSAIELMCLREQFRFIVEPLLTVRPEGHAKEGFGRRRCVHDPQGYSVRVEELDPGAVGVCPRCRRNAESSGSFAYALGCFWILGLDDHRVLAATNSSRHAPYVSVRGSSLSVQDGRNSHTDLLSQVLRELRLDSASFRSLLLRGEWRLRFDGPLRGVPDSPTPW
jgi:hypothetical protein